MSVKQNVSLDESLELQRDHARRCEILAKEGKFQPQDEADESYCDALNLIPLDARSGNILDVGCQTGEAKKYMDQVGNFEYFGLEILPEIAEIAINNGIPNVKVGFAEKMPYADRSFNVVWARHVLEHMTDMKVALAESKRVMKDSGLLVFTVPVGTHNEPAHIYEISREDWEQLFIENGFTIIESGQHNYNLNEFYGVAVKA